MMMTTNCKEFLGKLLPCFDASLTAYRAYLSEGKTYRNACVLKIHNEQALSLLLNHVSALPPAYQPDARALADHYSAWKAKWEELAMQLNPAPGDVFVFPNDITFPRGSAQRLEALYKEMADERLV